MHVRCANEQPMNSVIIYQFVNRINILDFGKYFYNRIRAIYVIYIYNIYIMIIDKKKTKKKKSFYYIFSFYTRFFIPDGIYAIT